MWCLNCCSILVLLGMGGGCLLRNCSLCSFCRGCWRQPPWGYGRSSLLPKCLDSLLWNGLPDSHCPCLCPGLMAPCLPARGICCNSAHNGRARLLSWGEEGSSKTKSKLLTKQVGGAVQSQFRSLRRVLVPVEKLSPSEKGTLVTPWAMTQELWLPIASLHLPLLWNAGTGSPAGVQRLNFWWATLLICHHCCRSDSWYLIRFLIRRNFMMLAHAKAPAGGKPVAGHNSQCWMGWGKHPIVLYFEKENIQGRNCAASLPLFSVSAQQTRPTCHSPCPKEHLKVGYL